MLIRAFCPWGRLLGERHRADHGEKVGLRLCHTDMDFSNEVETPGDQVADIEAAKTLFLGQLINNGKPGAAWVNAVTKNVSTFNPATGGTSAAVGAYAYRGNGSQDAGVAYGTSPTQNSNAPYLGSFQSFLNSTYVQGGVTHYFYEHSLDHSAARGGSTPAPIRPGPSWTWAPASSRWFPNRPRSVWRSPV